MNTYYYYDNVSFFFNDNPAEKNTSLYTSEQLLLLSQKILIFSQSFVMTSS